MIRKATFSPIVAIALTLAILMGLLLTPVTDHVYADGAAPTPTSSNSGASGGGNTGG